MSLKSKIQYDLEDAFRWSEHIREGPLSLFTAAILVEPSAVLMANRPGLSSLRPQAKEVVHQPLVNLKAADSNTSEVSSSDINCLNTDTP